ncbi:MAG: glycoside hydrolase [Treponema sp.]|nr:glycoside hydrolase [Treponema sp.]
MKQLFLFIMVLVFVFLPGCGSSRVVPVEQEITQETLQETPVIEEEPQSVEAEFTFVLPEGDLPVSTFREIWAYLISGQEEYLSSRFPLSDVGYFAAELDSYGKLVNVPDRRKISFFRGRVHLVVVCNGTALTHFALKEGSEERRQLIADLLEASRAYDGLQIDFENVPPRDGDAFLSFLRELRAGLGNKMFTIALPARTRTISNDVYDYAKIKDIVDRILVMAYDEHWSNSAPGPIASLDWCRRIAAYALETIGREKLIMGLPFYGRTWGDINPNRAFFHSGIQRIRREQGVNEIQRVNGIPTFRYQTTLTVTVYYEDAYSLSTRLALYRSMGAVAAGFWCLGQETPEIWSLLEIGPN